MRYTKDFKDISKEDVLLAGGKGASLGEMTQAGIPVPPGFVVLSSAFDAFLAETDMGGEIATVLDTVNTVEMHTVEHASEKIQALILNASMPVGIADEIMSAHTQLGAEFVAVRSSATAEDSASAAWAGQLDSFLNTTQETLLQNIQKCWASLFTPRAIFYGFEKGFYKSGKGKVVREKCVLGISVAVVVQAMVQSEVSGIAFSVHPVTQDTNQLIIEAGYGLGEAIVSGQITPDSYVVTKSPLEIIDKNVSTQDRMLIRSKDGGNEWVSTSVIPAHAGIQSTSGSNTGSPGLEDSPEDDKVGDSQKLSDSQILALSRLIIKIENHYGFPCDIEWAFSNGKLHITQSRPITTLVEIKELANTGSNYVLQVQSKQWQLDGIYRNSVLFTSAVFPYLGYENFSQIGLAAGLSNAIRINKEHYTEVVGARKLYELTLKNIEQNEGYLNNFIDGSRKSFAQMESESKLIIQSTTPALNSAEIVKHLQDFFHTVARVVPWFWGMGFVGEALDTYVKAVIHHWHPEWDRLAVDNFIMQVSYISKNHAEDDEQDEITGVSKENDLSGDFLRGLYSKYSWLSINIWEGRLYTLPEYMVHIKEIFKNKATLISKKSDNVAMEQRSLHVLSGVSDKNVLRVLQSMRELIFLRTEQMDVFARSWANMLPLMDRVAENLHLTPAQLLLCTVDEVLNALQNRATINITNLEPRSNSVACLRLDNQMHYLTGTVVGELKTAILGGQDVGASNVLSGSVAFGGMVRGTVKVVLSSKDINKVKLGDILVSHATNSNYDPAFGVAGGVVTDEGGVLCHTAILAREFRVPCVIATKIATQVLHDGDLVEVDANTGVVRILERAK